MKKRKPFVVGSFLAALLTVYPLCMVHNYSEVLLLAALQGFFFLPALALLLEVASELSGERLAGASTGLLMLSVNVGAVIVIVAMEWIKGDSLTFYRAVLLMAAVLLAAFLTSLTLPETGGSKK